MILPGGSVKEINIKFINLIECISTKMYYNFVQLLMEYEPPDPISALFDLLDFIDLLTSLYYSHIFQKSCHD